MIVAGRMPLCVRLQIFLISRSARKGHLREVDNRRLHFVLCGFPWETPVNSFYQILLNTYNYTLAKVQVEEYKNLSDSSLDVGKTIFELSMANQGFNKNISAQNIIIDGNKGFVVTGMNPKNLRLWQAYYWLDSTDCECGPVSVGKTEIGIISLYPLNVTRNLINSLHVENIKQPAKPKTLTFGPPKMS